MIGGREKSIDSNSAKNVKDLVGRLRTAFGRMIWNRGKRSIAKAPEIVVISPGGVASTLLMKHLSTYVSVNSAGDRDGLKHLARPPSNVNKAILITGNAEEVAKSLRKRGYLGIHAAKMGSPLGVLLSGKAQEKHFQRLVRNQRKNFESSGSSTLVIDYDNIWDSCSTIAEFAEITDAEFCNQFPSRKSRR